MESKFGRVSCADKVDVDNAEIGFRWVVGIIYAMSGARSNLESERWMDDLG
jgi:hypothetical protein